MPGMTKEMAKALRVAIDHAFTSGQPIAEVEAKFGVRIRLGNSTYDPTGLCTFKLECAIKTESGEVVTKDMSYLDAVCKQMGIETVRGKTVKRGTKTFTVVGYKSRGRQPFIVKDENGGMYLLPADENLKEQLGFYYPWERDPSTITEGVVLQSAPTFGRPYDGKGNGGVK